MDYYRFNSYPVKARMAWVQKILELQITGQRDKATIKALSKFQKEHGLSGNAIINEETFNLLYHNGGSKINMRKEK